jgi:hypothetical protein
MTSPACPHVYRAISAITAAFAKDGIAKTHTNIRDQYQYRSIDDVLNRLGPLLAKHRLCVLPRVLKHRMRTQVGEQDSLLTSVQLLAAFDLVSARDGSCHTVQGWGEALDGGDKGTAKAMSSAYKSAMLQAFCIPVATDDPDASSRRLKLPASATEPTEGWPMWCDGICDMIGLCESLDALDRVRTRQGTLLAALKRERPELYTRIGEAFTKRSEELAAPKTALQAKAKPAARKMAPVMETVDG